MRYLIRDRDSRCPALFDTVLADSAITVVRSGVRIPRMNSIMERWIQACRHELLDRALIWNHTHLLHALREYEHHHKPAPPAPQHRQRPTAASAASAAQADHRPHNADTPPRPPTRQTRRPPPRIRERRLTSTDETFGTRRATSGMRLRIVRAWTLWKVTLRKSEDGAVRQSGTGSVPDFRSARFAGPSRPAWVPEASSRPPSPSPDERKLPTSVVSRVPDSPWFPSVSGRRPRG